ncbi:MAG: GIY-YIG nuclease family protein [Spartobacteria bacterium]
MDNTYYVYMMTNRSRVVLYTGVTNSLERRLWFHGNASDKAFTKRYKVDRLVYYESYEDVRDAISREIEIKGWRREKKNDLVRTLNPTWEDLGKRYILSE